MDIQALIQIGKDLNLQDKVQELMFYADRLSSSDKDLILPLVGEFSSGKTTLINSLLDNPNLETASRATTASIFEIHFGADECRAEIVDEEGTVHEVKNVADIRNSELRKVDVVKVFDTSTKIGTSTILVDTPGLSSNDPQHRIALSSYLPKADAVLLLTDVNQQLTRSIIDFIKTSKLANRPIYAVITKCDTKTPNEVASAKSYIETNIEFPFERIISISSTTGDMSQFDNLIADMQRNKNEIVANSVAERCKDVAREMLLVVQNLLKQANSTKDIDNAIREEERKLENLNRNISKLIRDVESKVEEKTDKAISSFSKIVFSQLDAIVKSQGRDCDNAINSAVNSIAVMIAQNYQKDVISEILALARTRQYHMEEVPMGVLETISMTENAFNGFSTNTDFANIGHKWDKVIGYGVLAVGAAVVTAGAVLSSSAAAAGSAATTTVSSTAVSNGTVIAADAATDIASAAYVNRQIKKMSKAEMYQMGKEFAGKVSENMTNLNLQDQKLGEKAGMKRGLIETSVGWVTDFFAKPARQRAVNDYIESSLIPEFRQYLITTSSNLMRNISSLLNKEAVNSCEDIRSNLQSLKNSLNEQKDEYVQRIERYKYFEKQLNNI